MNYLRPAIIGLLAALALLPAAPAHAQDATGRIAFTRGSFDSSDIYVMNGDGSGQTNLTNNPANDREPAWSPDGTKIAFTRGPFDSSDIYVMNADGSGQTNLTNNATRDSDPAWVPDGSRIVFSSNRHGPAFLKYVMDADGSSQESADLGKTVDQSFAWSPDGSRIAFVRTDVVGTGPAPRTRPQIYVMNADGTGAVRLTDGNPDGNNFSPTWSADGARIAYTSNFEFGRGPMEIYIMNADGSGNTRLTDDADLFLFNSLDWSPDRNLFTYSSCRNDACDIYVRNADGSGETNLTNNPARDIEPVWAPLAIAEPTPEPEAAAPSATGKIAFTSDRDGNSEIYVMNADGSGQTNLTDHPARDSDPTWYHDGSRIAFVSDRDGNAEIYVMNADGSGQTNLTNNSAADFTPAWSPGGSRIAFVSNRDVGAEIFVMNADGSGQTQLTDAPGGDLFPTWSPDGSRIAFISFGEVNFVVYVMNADGSGLTRLTNNPADVQYSAWSPASSRIAFLSTRDDPNQSTCSPLCNIEIYVMNADGSGQTRLTNNPAAESTPAWSPDGFLIAFTSDRDGNSEIYVMNADGSGQTNLTNNSAADLDPTWSPGLVPTLAGAPQTAFVESVPGPDEISTDPEVVGSNIALTLFVIFTFAFTSALFNQTLSYNRREIEGWVGRFFTPFRRFSDIVEQRYGAVAEGRPWIQRVAGPAVILVLTGLIYGFLSPDFGFNTRSAVLFLALAVGVGAVTYVYAGGEALFTRRRFGLQAGVKLYAVALAIAVGSVLVSRLMDFQPGFLFGFVASYTLLATGTLDRRQQGQAVLFAAIALLALSLIAWFLVIPLRDVRQESDAWWWALPEGTAVAVFVAGLQGLFFSMVPLNFMDGAKIAQWNRLLWLLLFGAAAFLFWSVLLNQEGAFLKALEQRRVVAALVLLSLYSIITLVTWLYFRGRVYGWSLPSLLRRQAAPGGAASESRPVTTAQPRLRKSVPMPVFLATIALAGVAIIAITVLAFALRGDGGAESGSVVAVAGTPTVAAPPSSTPAPPTVAATPTFTTIDRATCDQPSELAELAQELAILRDKGYVVCDPSTYLPGGALHVLIGVLEDSSDSFTQWAFFFVGGEYLGTDSISTSVSISVVSQTANTVTLSYAMFRPDDQACCPSAGEAIVPYDWDGTRLTPRVDIPPTDGPISRR